MQIRTRLTILFTVIVAALFALFASVIYFSSAETREEEYYKRLVQQATVKANLLFNSNIQPSVLQLIYRNAPNILYQEEVAIYDTAFQLLYHDAVDVDKVKETHGMIDSILKLGEIRFSKNKMQVVGFEYRINNRKYAITAAAIDAYGFNKLVQLRNTLIVLFVVSIILIFLAGRFLSVQSLKPVAVLIDKVKRITAANLDIRVNEGNRKDEIAALAITFNQMLDRLEASFDAQKAFVSNISHELRTPLTAMLTELQLTAAKPRTIQEYQEAIHHITSDTKRLVRLSNSLLDFAKASYDPQEISFKEIRMDEVLMDARADLLHSQTDYKITIHFDDDSFSNEYFLHLHANAYLLKVAFINLMENACKYSDDKICNVFIKPNAQEIELQFVDKGIGISPDEMEQIFKPFYRGGNKQFAEGNGIGLSLSEKIIHLHKGNIAVRSEIGKGSTFIVKLPKDK